MGMHALRLDSTLTKKYTSPEYGQTDIGMIQRAAGHGEMVHRLEHNLYLATESKNPLSGI